MGLPARCDASCAAPARSGRDPRPRHRIATAPFHFAAREWIPEPCDCLQPSLFPGTTQPRESSLWEAGTVISRGKETGNSLLDLQQSRHGYAHGEACTEYDQHIVADAHLLPNIFSHAIFTRVTRICFIVVVPDTNRSRSRLAADPLRIIAHRLVRMAGIDEGEVDPVGNLLPRRRVKSVSKDLDDALGLGMAAIFYTDISI